MPIRPPVQHVHIQLVLRLASCDSQRNRCRAGTKMVPGFAPRHFFWATAPGSQALCKACIPERHGRIHIQTHTLAITFELDSRCNILLEVGGLLVIANVGSLSRVREYFRRKESCCYFTVTSVNERWSSCFGLPCPWSYHRAPSQ